MDMAILDMPVRSLPQAWEECVRDAMSTKKLVEEEIRTSERAHVSYFCTPHLRQRRLMRNLQTDELSRTFDFEPLITTFITVMHAHNLLQPILVGNTSITASPQAETASSKRKGKAKR